MITRNQVNKKVKNKAQYYSAMVRNGYLMPTIKCTIVTIRWMEGVRFGKYWCPLQADLHRNIQIANMPSKAQLADMLFDLIESYVDNNPQLPQNQVQAMLKTADLILERPPNHDFMINAIGILDNNHAIFARNYVPPMAAPRRVPAFLGEFDNADGFFDDLPDLNEGQQRKRGLALPKHVQLTQQIMRLEYVNQNNLQQIGRLREDLAAVYRQQQTREAENYQRGRELRLQRGQNDLNQQQPRRQADGNTDVQANMMQNANPNSNPFQSANVNPNLNTNARGNIGQNAFEQSLNMPLHNYQRLVRNAEQLGNQQAFSLDQISEVNFNEATRISERRVQTQMQQNHGMNLRSHNQEVHEEMKVNAPPRVMHSPPAATKQNQDQWAQRMAASKSEEISPNEFKQHASQQSINNGLFKGAGLDQFLASSEFSKLGSIADRVKKRSAGKTNYNSNKRKKTTMSAQFNNAVSKEVIKEVYEGPQEISDISLDPELE